MQSSGAQRTSVNASPRPGAGAGLTHACHIDCSPRNNSNLGDPLGEDSGVGPADSRMRHSLPLWAKLGGLPGLRIPRNSATQIATCSTGVPRQTVLMNATDAWNTFRGQHSPALHPDTPRCHPSLPSPSSNPTFEHWPPKQGGQDRPPRSSARTSVPMDWTCRTSSPGTLSPRGPLLPP